MVHKSILNKLIDDLGLTVLLSSRDQNRPLDTRASCTVSRQTENKGNERELSRFTFTFWRLVRGRFKEMLMLLPVSRRAGSWIFRGSSGITLPEVHDPHYLEIEKLFKL